MPPRKSRPRYMGNALIAVNHAGESEIRLSARINEGLSATGFNARSSTSLAFNCVSVSRNRTLMLLGSVKIPSYEMAAALSACSTACMATVSTLAVVFSGDT